MVLDELDCHPAGDEFPSGGSQYGRICPTQSGCGFVTTPRLYREYTTNHVLVMEYIDGFAINDKENLLENGYDLNEIGTKLVDNYIRQVMEDGFFSC